MVYRAFKYILWTYTRIPGNLWRIFKVEAGRAFDGFVGLPVRERTWKLDAVSLEDMVRWEQGVKGVEVEGDEVGHEEL